jgi:transcriptional regulator with XRE-family HTH domain
MIQAYPTKNQTLHLINYFNMEHQGAKLKRIAKAKGYNIRQLAEKFGLTDEAVRKHFKRERVSRTILLHYATLFKFSMDKFYEDESFNSEDLQSVDTQEFIKTQRELISALRKVQDLTQENLKLKSSLKHP